MDEEKLIHLVSQYRELYDYTYPHYSNQSRKETCWREIARAMGLPEGKCREKWSNLRNNFRRSVRKRERGLSGQGRKKKFKWRYEEQMSFLLPFFTERDLIVFRCDDGLDSSAEWNELANSPGDEEQHSRAGSPASTKDSTFPCSLGLKRIWKEEEQERHVVESGGNDWRRVAANAAAAEERGVDILTEFFLNMANTVKTLPPLLQTTVKRQVFEAVISAEMSLLQKQEPPSPAPLPST